MKHDDKDIMRKAITSTNASSFLEYILTIRYKIVNRWMALNLTAQDRLNNLRMAGNQRQEYQFEGVQCSPFYIQEGKVEDKTK